MVCEGVLGLDLLEEEEEFLINIMSCVIRELDVLLFPGGLKFADGIVHLCWSDFSCHCNIADISY